MIQSIQSGCSIINLVQNGAELSIIISKGIIESRKMSSTNVIENVETKICKKCGRILPVDKFRLVKGQFHNPYYLENCKECEYKYQREYLEEKNRINLSDNIEMLIQRRYKDITLRECWIYQN